MEAKLIFDQVSKIYGENENIVQVLHDISFSIQAGEFVAVVGPSGSGKSTFLSIAGALLSPTQGKIILDGHDITKYSQDKLTKIRLQKIGFIFQTSNLIPYLSVRNQLLLIGKMLGQSGKLIENKAKALLENLGLEDRLKHYPNQLSGGQLQRVAIARAFMNDPEIILADEPTASLDSKRGRNVVEMLANEVKLQNKAAIMVTHDERVLDLCDRVIQIKDGRLLPN